MLFCQIFQMIAFQSGTLQGFYKDCMQNNQTLHLDESRAPFIGQLNCFPIRKHSCHDAVFHQIQQKILIWHNNASFQVYLNRCNICTYLRKILGLGQLGKCHCVDLIVMTELSEKFTQMLAEAHCCMMALQYFEFFPS